MKKSNRKKHIFVELLGWYGVVAILSAYMLISFEYLSPKSLTYQLLNLTGSFGIMIDAYLQRNYQPVVLNIVWLGIALFAIISILIT